jgi:hypothetical protein
MVPVEGHVDAEVFASAYGVTQVGVVRGVLGL